MDVDLFIAVTADVMEFARLQTKIANTLIDRLEKQFPRNMHEFFPRALSPLPDLDFASTYGRETLENVRDAAEAVLIAMQAREELASRRFPN